MTPLVTLTAVKLYLDIPSANTNSDAVLNSLISGVSAYAANQANLPPREDGDDPTFFEDDYLEHYDGTGSDRLFLRHAAPSTPVSKVSLVTIDTIIVPVSPGPPQWGFIWDRFSVRLRGWKFCKGQQNVTVKYTAGYDPASSTGIALSSAAAEWVAQIYKQRPHIDVRAKTLDHETVSYVATVMPDRMLAILTNLKTRMAA